jgi:hypothetical protein
MLPTKTKISYYHQSQRRLHLHSHRLDSRDQCHFHLRTYGCESAVLPLCYNCTGTLADRITGSSDSIREVSRAIIAQW